MGAVIVSSVPAPYSRNEQHKEFGDDMAAEIAVIGMDAEIGGLDESVAAFAKHHREVGDALLNISGIGTATGDVVKKDVPRPAYRHEAWPKMVYHPDGRERIVANPGELKAAIEDRFRETPYPKAQVAVGDPAAEKKALLERNQELEGKLTVQNEMLTELLTWKKSMEKKLGKGGE